MAGASSLIPLLSYDEAISHCKAFFGIQISEEELRRPTVSIFALIVSIHKPKGVDIVRDILILLDQSMLLPPCSACVTVEQYNFIVLDFLSQLSS